jgi:hypothetical protein
VGASDGLDLIDRGGWLSGGYLIFAIYQLSVETKSRRGRRIYGVKDRRETYMSPVYGPRRDHLDQLTRTHSLLHPPQTPFRGQLPSHGLIEVWEQDPYFGTYTIVDLPFSFAHHPAIKEESGSLLVVLNAARSPRSFPFTSLPPKT